MWVGFPCTCRSFNKSQISEIIWAPEHQTIRDRLKNQLLDGENAEKVILLGLHTRWKQTLTYFNTWKIHSRGITRNCHFGLRERHSTKHWKSYPSIMVLREFKIKSHVHPRNVYISTTEYDEVTGHTSERKSHFVHFRGNPFFTTLHFTSGA